MDRPQSKDMLMMSEGNNDAAEIFYLFFFKRKYLTS